MPRKDASYPLPLGAGPAPVNYAHLPEPRKRSFLQVIFKQERNFLRRKGVKIDKVLDRNPARPAHRSMLPHHGKSR
jgi:hypothetical protein